MSGGWSTRWDALVEFLVPVAISEPDERARARFTVTGWLMGIPLISTFSVLYFLNQLWGQLALQVFTVMSGTLLLWFLRRTGRVKLVQQVSLGVFTVSFGLGGIAQTPADPSSVYFLVVVPLLAAFLLSLRAAWLWMAVSLVVGVVLLQLGQHGYTLPQRDPDLGTSMSLNFAFCLTVVVLFARSYSAERQRALEQIRAADRARAAFLANVSHEIRTPMNGVLGMTQVLLDGSLSAEQREQLLVIQRSGDALVALINDVLDSSKVEAGQLTVSREGDFDLRALLEDLAHLYEPMAKDKGLALAVDVGGGVVRGDGLRVRQVLGNLLSNAVKFTQSGSVRLLVERDGAQVRFTVEDTGAGIPPALRSRLFKPFQQGDDTSTKRYPGTGLGLSLSLQLATLLGGSLVLDEAYAAGARFVFSVALPVVEPRAPAVAVASPTRPAEGLAVLVVDDNPVNLAVARALVSKAGYVVQTATNGRDALAAVQGRAFAAVLMDVMMPEMDGLEATRQIRALPGPEREVPIIALTASAMPEELAACRAAGMNEVLTKPVVAAALTHALGAYARRG